MTSNTDVAAGPTVAESLREVANWLEAHPEQPIAFALVRVDAWSREDLESLAEALGERATEEVSYGEVRIAAHFGVVDVYAGVALNKLAGAPVVPDYEPILPARSDTP